MLAAPGPAKLRQSPPAGYAARASAGIIAGFFLAAALIGLASWFWPGPWEATLVMSLLAFFPLWTGLACAAFRFNNGKQAWAWLGTPALIGLGLLRLLQAMDWVR